MEYQDPDDIRRQLSGDKPFFSDQKKSAGKKKRSASGNDRTPDKPRQPRASLEASSLGQQWYDLGTANGFEFPYDANFFALALERKISADPEFQKLIAENDRAKVDRWVTKMITLWWEEADEDGLGGYFTNEIRPGNAKEYFLVQDWDDLRDYARSCLRAAYLKKYGRRVPMPDNPNQQEYRQRLEDVHREHQVHTYVRDVDLDAEPPKVDASARERLRSWRENRRKK